MDMVFRNDEYRIRKGNAPANFATIKHSASNILRSVKGKHSLRTKRQIAAWDDDFLAEIIRTWNSYDSTGFTCHVRYRIDIYTSAVNLDSIMILRYERTEISVTYEYNFFSYKY